MAEKRRNRVSKGAKRNEYRMWRLLAWLKHSGSWGARGLRCGLGLATMSIMLLLPMNLTVVILVGQCCTSIQIHYIFHWIKNDKSPPHQRTRRECLSPFLVEFKLGTSSHFPVRPRNALNGQGPSICSGVGPGCGQQEIGASLPCVTVALSRSEEAGFLKAGLWLFLLGATNPS